MKDELMFWSPFLTDEKLCKSSRFWATGVTYYERHYNTLSVEYRKRCNASQNQNSRSRELLPPLALVCHCSAT